MCVCACVCACVFSVRKTAQHHSWLSWHRATRANLHRQQIRVFQMNNTKREMTKSPGDQRFNARGAWKHNWFPLLNVTRLQEPPEQPPPPPPTRRDAVKQLCAEPGSLYKSGCASTGGVQQEGESAKSHRLIGPKVRTHEPARTPPCRPRTRRSAGDFSCVAACFWRVPLKTSADRRSSFAPPCPRIWTYARPRCRTVCRETT